MTTTITLPRATVEQALEALEWASDLNHVAAQHKPMHTAVTNLRAALNKPQRPDDMKNVYASLREKAMRNRP